MMGRYGRCKSNDLMTSGPGILARPGDIEARPVGVEAWAFGTGAVLGFLVSLGVMLYLFSR